MLPTTQYKQTISLIRLTTLLCLLWALTVSVRHLSTGSASSRTSVVDSSDTTPSLPDTYTAGDNVSDYENIKIVSNGLWNRADAAGSGYQQSDTFTKYLAKGCVLEGMFRNPNAPQSKWTGYNDLEKYGWTRTEDSVNSYWIPPDVWEPLDAIGAPDPGDSFAEPKGIEWVHDRESTVDGTTYHPTRGNDDAFYYPDSGIIVATNSHSPQNRAEASLDGNVPGFQFEGGPYVPLGRWSDIVFLEYENLCKTADKRDGGLFDPNKLRVVFRAQVINMITRRVIFESLQRNNVDGPQRWPGTTFTMDTDEGKAILGTPNGNGVAWILFSHREKLGAKTVKSVVVFDNGMTDSGRKHWKIASQPCLLFHIEDVPESEMETGSSQAGSGLNDAGAGAGSGSQAGSDQNDEKAGAGCGSQAESGFNDAETGTVFGSQADSQEGENSTNSG